MLRKLLDRLTAPPVATADRLIAEGARAEQDGKLREACEIYRRAVESAPGYAKAHLNLGAGLQAAGDSDGALEAYRAALTIDPANVYANYNLGSLLSSRGELARAEQLLRIALEGKPDFPEAQLAVADVHEMRGDLAAAATALEAALRQRPDYAGAWHNYGLVLSKCERLAEAEAAWRRATQLEPAFAPAFYFLGGALAYRGRAAEAAACYRRVLELQPDFAEAHCNLGDALKELGQLEAAIASYREALRLKPDYVLAHCHLGFAQRDQGRLDQAHACFQRALEIEPDFAEAHYGRGHAFYHEDRHEEALGCFRQALSVDPGNVHARWSLTMSQLPAVYPAAGDPVRCRAAFSLELAELERSLEATRAADAFNAVGHQQPFYLAYQEHSNRDLLQRHGRLCTRVMSEWFERQGLSVPAERAPDGVIRVGVVSQHFCNQSVWNAIVKGWFEKLDRERVALDAYYLGIIEDQETRVAMARASHFERGAGGLRQWVDAILRRQPDVLIYPGIGMDPTALKLASLRLAPVQVASWGHPETTGLPTVDYYLSAEDLEPLGAQEHYTERLVVLPHLGCCYPRWQVLAASSAPALLDADPGVALLLCPGVPYKYLPQYDCVLTEIARRLGRCRFVFFTYRVSSLSEKLRRRLEAAFVRARLDAADFVRFVPWQNTAEFFGILKRADVFLDTIGFSGFNTAMQALDCGLPIVTREGRFLRGRLASGILKRMGLAQLVAQSEEDYVTLAVKLVQDPEYRRHVRERIAASRDVLFDDVAPVRALEAFLTKATGRS